MTIENPNPKIKKVFIGKRVLKEIEIIPLSIADQFKLSDIITESINYAVKAATEQRENIEFVTYIVGVIQRNLDRILAMSVDISLEPDVIPPVSESNHWIFESFPYFHSRERVASEKQTSLLDDITNDQALEIAMAIYEINYGEIIKKVQGLLDGTKEIPGLLRGLLQSFFANIPSTDSTTSTEANPGEKVG
jgi:hypothetical protein